MTTEKKGRIHTFPFDADNPTGPQRSSEQHHQHAADAVTLGAPVSE